MPYSPYVIGPCFRQLCVGIGKPKAVAASAYEAQLALQAA